MTFEPDFCAECGDEFHYDDCGGYNPPCPCGCGLCRSCHDANESYAKGWDDDYERPEDSYPPEDEPPKSEIPGRGSSE